MPPAQAKFREERRSRLSQTKEEVDFEVFVSSSSSKFKHISGNARKTEEDAQLIALTLLGALEHAYSQGGEPGD